MTLARRQATKGSYRLSAADLEAHAHWLDDVLVLLLPLRHWREPLDAVRVEQEARWLAELHPGASWIACELTRGIDDAAQLEALQAMSDTTGLPLVAAGDVQMHARRRKRLHDVLTAVRVKTPLAQCGRELAPNAERYLRPLYRLARIYPTELLLQTQAIAERCTFSLDELRYEYPEEIVPPGETPATWLRRATYEEAKTRYPDGMPEKVQAIVEHELAADRRAALRAVLPHRLRHRPLRALAGHPVPGAWLGGQLGGVLLPRHHRGRSGAHVACCSSASSARSATSRRTSTSTSSTSAAKR